MMSFLLESRLSDDRRAEADAADAKQRTVVEAALHRLRMADIADTVKRLPAVTLDEARRLYIENTARAPATLNNSQLFQLGMECGVQRVLRLLQGYPA